MYIYKISRKDFYKYMFFNMAWLNAILKILSSEVRTTSALAHASVNRITHHTTGTFATKM